MYQIKILADNEFDKLPYKRVKTSLGCANPKTNTAYVRNTRIPGLNLLTIDHELNELFAKTSPHEEDGIRYLDLGSVFGGSGDFFEKLSNMTNTVGNVTGTVSNIRDIWGGEGSTLDKVSGTLGNVSGLLGGGDTGTPSASTFGQNVLGNIGTAQTLVNAFPQPEVPELGETIAKWLTADTVTKAGAEAREMAKNTFGAPWDPSAETIAFINVMEKDIRKNYKTRRESLDKTAIAVNEQWMRSGERFEMLRRIEEEEQREVDMMKSQWLLQDKQTWATQNYNYVMNELQVDQQTKNDLLSGDIWSIMEKYQLEQKDVEDFRSIAVMAGLYDTMLQNQGVDAAQLNQMKQQAAVGGGAGIATLGKQVFDLLSGGSGGVPAAVAAGPAAAATAGQLAAYNAAAGGVPAAVAAGPLGTIGWGVGSGVPAGAAASGIAANAAQAAAASGVPMGAAGPGAAEAVASEAVAGSGISTGAMAAMGAIAAIGLIAWMGKNHMLGNPKEEAATWESIPNEHIGEMVDNWIDVFPELDKEKLMQAHAEGDYETLKNDLGVLHSKARLALNRSVNSGNVETFKKLLQNYQVGEQLSSQITQDANGMQIDKLVAMANKSSEIKNLILESVPEQQKANVLSRLSQMGLQRQGG